MIRLLTKLTYRIGLSRPLTTLYDRVHAHFYSPATLGQRGELAAERFLLRQGLTIVARGYEDKSGEIDLIAVDGDTIVFVEVKTRQSDHAGSPAEAVDAKKQAHLTKTGIGYLKWHRLTECKARFDVIAIIWPTESNHPEITHFENAFEPVGEFQMF
jgi:putative endonuclease